MSAGGRSSDGVWVAVYLDRSAVIPFKSELSALRYAQQHSMTVRWVPWGIDVLEDPT